MNILAIDTGGTFTDLASYDIETGEVKYTKSLTTYEALEHGVFDCIQKVGLKTKEAQSFKHGTTLVINSLLQRVGAKVGLITTSGFRDILETGRGNRPDPFDLYYRRDSVLVPRESRFEVNERMSGSGVPVVSPLLSQIQTLAIDLKAQGFKAIGISFLNSYLNDAHELLVSEWLKDLLPDIFITRGTELTREWYEFERTATVAANAYVGPQVAGYVKTIDQQLKRDGFQGEFFMMGSGGGVLALEKALKAPISLVESGPVGGCIGVAAYAKALGIEHAIAFDMGGTTAKCALVHDGDFDIKSTYYVGGYARGFPIRGAVIDIVEVGAGGGSIAWSDVEGRLFVGPKSAGSTPGPVCYDRGGQDPTVTDANLTLGRIDEKSFLGGTMSLRLDLARKFITERLVEPLGFNTEDGLARMADGIIKIASVTMAGAIKRITLEKGLDPREYAMFAFGGGGPLHAFEIARQLHIPLVIIPPEPGNFSALGMLLSRLRLDETTTFLSPLDNTAIKSSYSIFSKMQGKMELELLKSSKVGQLSFEKFAEIRYRGQVHSVRTPLENLDEPLAIRGHFEEIYKARYGHANSKNPVEIVSLSMVAYGSMDQPDLAALAPTLKNFDVSKVHSRPVYFSNNQNFVPTNVYNRSNLPSKFYANGPALIEEYGSTTVVSPEDSFKIGELGEIQVRIGSHFIEDEHLKNN